MADITELLSYDFIQNALWAGLLASVLCGVIGTFVVVKRLVFISGGISHAAFGGLGICYYLGWHPLLGATVVSVAAALAVGAFGRERGRFQDAMIGILWAVGMALGVVFIYKTPGYAPNLMTYLFGNILTVGRGDLRMTLGLVLLLLTLLALFFKEFVAVSFDETFAEVQGVPARLIVTTVLVLTALAIIFLIQLVGIILVMALLTIPPMVGLLLVHTFSRLLVVSSLVGALMTLGGLFLSYSLDLPSGPAIVLLGFLLLAAVGGTMRLRRILVTRNPAP
jgi:zinc transport system permease protein